MKIHIITHYYPPEIGAPQARLSEMAKVWKKAGHEVTVLTGFPNHPTGIIPKDYNGRIFQKECINGVDIWRHWLYATPNKGILKKTLSHVSFMISVVLLSLFRGNRPDVIIVSSPTFFSVISAYLFSIFRSAPFVFEVRDLWPGIFIELGILKNRILIYLLEKMEIFLYLKARAVVAVTKGFKKDIVKRGISDEKCHVITNGVDVERFFPQDKNLAVLKELEIPENDFIILYVGAHGISHGLPSVLSAAAILQEKGDKSHFLFVGEGAVKSRLIELKKELKLANVSFHLSMPKDKMPELYSSCDLCLVPLKDIPGFKTFIPSKMFEILGTGKPILASLSGEAKEILMNSGGAVVVSPENPQEMAQAVLDLKKDREKLHEMGGKGRAFVLENYDRKKLALKYLEILKNIIL